MKIFFYTFLLLLLPGCSLYHSMVDDAPVPEATLADLQPVSLPPKKEVPASKSLEELAQLYRSVLPLTSDPDILLSVRHRLADIEMLMDENTLAEEGGVEGLFDDAIAAYQQLLANNPNSPKSDQYLYQLSKAFELNGDNEQSLAVLAQLSDSYPDSWYYAESEFRRAENSFVLGDYASAEAGYASVIAAGDTSVYYSKALYMQGWSRFKQNQYSSAIEPFTASLDTLMPGNGELNSLHRSSREQVDDSFRVLAVIFDYLGGASAVTEAYQQLGTRSYQYLFYQSLGDLYLSQERFRDSAETYKAYIQGWPDSEVAHDFQIKVISTYEKGGFPDLVVVEKRFYVETFESRGDNWLRSSWATRNAIDSTLKQFIPELAQHHHASAQQLVEAKGDQSLALEHYSLAASYYGRFVQSFPNSEKVPELAFLLGESQFEAGNYIAAIESYEWLAYRYPQFEKSPDAAYSAIASYAKITIPDEQSTRRQWTNDRINSELRFTRVFPQDPRATAVLGHAAAGLFELEDYRGAARTGESLVQWRPQPALEIIVPAWLVMGHSYFELAEYSTAEGAYQSALTAMQREDRRYDDTVERVAASVYKQAELAASRGRYAMAAEEFSRVLVVAPSSSIRVNAQFDAAQNYIKAGDITEANRLLNDFRERYPSSTLTDSIAMTLVANYEEVGQWGQAAKELDAIYVIETDPIKKRQALYLAAQYYDKASENELAILRFRSYAHAYNEPFAIQLEAMQRLAQLYSNGDENSKQRFWLQKIIDSHDTAGSGQSDRSLFLAASSASVLADEEYRQFLELELSAPLSTSLKKKKTAMDKALAAYNKTNSYGIEQFSTLATYRLGHVYQRLSIDLLESERPSNLDALALQQYELLLEEQAFPFEEKAIAIYQTNARRSWEGVYDQWVQESFSALGVLMPARYAKLEHKALLGEGIY